MRASRDRFACVRMVKDDQEDDWIICHNMTKLEALLAKGPAGDAEVGLEQLRYTILSDGIPSNSDGMVSKQSQDI